MGGVPITFVPGTWMRPSAWSNWRNLFDRNGYEGDVATSPAVPVSLRTLADNATAPARATTAPILIGHRIGVVIAQVAVGRTRHAGAAIAIAPALTGWVIPGSAPPPRRPLFD
jgi:hypothetical protein